MTHPIKVDAMFAVPPPPLPEVKCKAPFVATGQPLPSGNRLLRRYHVKMTQLKAVQETMDRRKDSLTEMEWQKGTNSINVLSNEIEGVLDKITKRRKRKKRARKVNAVSNEERVVRRKELHARIDSWRRKQHDKLIQEKACNEDRRRLLETLKDNSRRSQEALSMIAKLDSTIKAGFSSHSADTVRKLNQLVAVWKDTLAEYVQERAQLGKTLGVESVAAVESLDQLHRELWLKCLFGTAEADWVPDYTLENFINVRAHWDCYLSNDINSIHIPFFWALPPTSCDPAWDKYRC